METLFIDNHLLALNKPAGLLTQPTLLESHSLEAVAKQWVKKEYNKSGNIFLHVLHRIDRPVSGIVLFARTSKALSRLNEKQRAGLFKKEYLAIVEGVMESREGILEHFLKRGSFMTKACRPYEAGSKQSALQFQVLKKGANRTLLKIELLTGRYHQIRAQLSTIGLPIVGDYKYGSKVQTDKMIYLHHAALSFPHPITEKLITLSSPPPTSWKYQID